MRARMLLLDGAWLTAVAVAGVVVILVDVNIGLPVLLDALALGL